MPINEGFHPAHPLPLVLDDQIEQQEIGYARDGAVVSSRILKAGVLIVAMTATGIAVLAMGDPVTLYADVTAAFVGNSAVQPDTDQSLPKIQAIAAAPVLVQSAADPQALPPAAKDVPARDEIAVSESAGKDQTEKSMPTSEALFMQFQAWAAEQDAQANVRPPVQDAAVEPVQDAPTQIVKRAEGNGPAANQLIQKRRPISRVYNARAEKRTEIVRKKRARRASAARVEQSPVDARAPVQSVQDAQASSFLPTLGLLRN